MEEKVGMNFLGVSRNQLQKENFVIFLIEENGKRELTIETGEAEALSLLAFARRIIPKRPLTHDLFSSVSRAFGIELKEVCLNEYHNGIYETEMVFSGNGTEMRINARASDAIALAVRLNAPIFAKKSLLDDFAYIPDTIKISVRPELTTIIQIKRKTLRDCSVDELKQRLQEAIDKEAYEQASVIQKELNDRNGASEKRESE